MKLEVIHENSSDPNTPQWFDEGLSFSCTQCGNCCTGGPGYVWISPQEIERLAAHLSMSVEQVTEKHLRKLGSKYSLREFRNDAGQYDCEFLIEQKSTNAQGRLVTRRVCGIYHVRPLQCRTWPFWDGLLESRESWNAAGKRCPGLNTGTQYSKSQILALRDASDWPEAAGQTSPGSGAAGQ
jgi:Fe-S-cluster containining protein